MWTNDTLETQAQRDQAVLVSYQKKKTPCSTKQLVTWLLIITANSWGQSSSIKADIKFPDPNVNCWQIFKSLYSETCANGHLYSETTCIKRPLLDVPKVSAQYAFTCIQRPPLYKRHYEVALAWLFNTGFTVSTLLTKLSLKIPQPFEAARGSSHSTGEQPKAWQICSLARLQSILIANEVAHKSNSPNEITWAPLANSFITPQSILLFTKRNSNLGTRYSRLKLLLTGVVKIWPKHFQNSPKLTFRQH